MGLDPRDSRLDVGFLLGDSDIPDDVDWDWSLRDKTAVWLDFIDSQFNPCVVDDYITCNNVNESSAIPVLASDNVIPEENVYASEPELSDVTTILHTTPIVMTDVHNAVSVKEVGNTIDVREVGNRVYVGKQNNVIVGGAKSNTVSVKNKKNRL